MNSVHNYSKKNDGIIYGIILFLLFFLPHNGVLVYINPLLLLFLAIRAGGDFRTVPGIMMMVVAVILSFIFSDTILDDSKSMNRAVSIILCLLLIPNVLSQKIPILFYYLGVLYILVSQLSYIYHWDIFTSFFNTHYVNEDTLDYYERYSNYSTSSVRYGGLYNNPNHCAKFTSFLLLLFLYDMRNQKWKKALPMILLSLYVILLTGSRTGMLFWISLVGLYFMSFVNRQNRVFIGLIMLIAAVLSLLLFSPSTEYRGFAIDEGMENSLGVKFKYLISYFKHQHSILNLLFGMFDANSNLVMDYIGNRGTMDSEWGWAIYTYGLVFFGSYVIFVIQMIRRLKNKGVDNILLLVFLWAITSTLFFSYRTLYVCVLLFARVFGKENEKDSSRVLGDGM